MARYDKYDPMSGGFRGAAAAAVASDADYGVPIGASINTGGAVVRGAAGNSGFVGVVIVDKTKRKAGDVLDVMTHGEIVYDSTETPLTAGTTYYLHATTGALQTTETRYHVGHTVEAWRLVVRFQDQGAA
jgi:hypothetical protein